MSSCDQHAKVNQWTNGVVESCLASLTKLQKPFKYIVTCVIMQVSVSSHKHLSHEGVIAFFTQPVHDSSKRPLTLLHLQKNGAGLHTASSCYWDNSTDGECESYLHNPQTFSSTFMNIYEQVCLWLHILMTCQAAAQ